jgi:hypothetical protein
VFDLVGVIARGVMDDKKLDTLSVAARRLSALPASIPISELEAAKADEEHEGGKKPEE